MDAYDFAPGSKSPPDNIHTKHEVHLPNLDTIHQVIKNPEFTPESVSPISEAELYRYNARLADLDCSDIRLIELLPGRDSERLRCHLRTVSLGDNLEYETVSYCWGRPIFFDAEIEVEENGKLPITSNLYNALLQLRHTDRSRTLWADVICVNQQDIEERTVQVQLMRQIFKQCRKVLIWLGDGTPSSDLAMDTILAIHLALEKKEAAGDRRLLHDLSNADRHRYGLTQERSPEMEALIALYQRPWFHRVWVVQELALPPSAMLLCGTKSLAWNTFTIVITSYSPSLKKFSTMENLGENHVRLSICPSWVEARANTSPPLLTLVARARNAQATDPRDKVFALVGLAQERGGAGVLGTPDYRLSVEQVYTQFVLDTVSASRNLDVLSLVHGRFFEDGEPDTQKLNIPSWVPDLSTRGIPYPLTRLDKFALESHATLRTKSDYQRHEASASTEAILQLEENGTAIHLSGYVFQTIGTELGLPFPGCTQWLDVRKTRHAQFNAWASWEAIVGTRTKQSTGGEAAYDVYWQTMRGGELAKHYAAAKKDFVTGYEQPLAAYRFLSLGRVIQSPTVFAIVHYLSCIFLDMFNFFCRIFGYPLVEYNRGIGTNVCEYRRMGKSAHGAVCLLPGATRPGDSLALFRGGRVPFVIRECGKSWRLIGEAYVHGVMNGEAWDGSRCGDMRLV